ncbi:MAG: nucleotidyl transferase AbiEii/AbiGii toxin family protein [Deltaproteobacteria bacterium]|nr:nucleotidyl transferase AbiEii/AbiGii toxin family protein [Deltaproteobacteria bacterium]
MRETLSEALARLARFATAWGHPYALVGGGAIVARVQPRLTTDLDLVIAVPEGGADALLALARIHGYAFDEQETRELLEGGLVRLWGPPSVNEGIGVDLMFVDSAFLEQVVERATPLDIAGATLQVASVEDLLLMKLEAGRPQDLDDAIAIKDAFGDRVDRAYLAAWARQLGIERELGSLLDPA